MGRFLKNRRPNAFITSSISFSRQEKNGVSSGNWKKAFSKFWLSKKGMAIPVTFLILFVSLSFIISLTYYFAVSRVNSRSQLLKVSAAKQNMFSLENSVASVAWSPGSSKVHSFNDYGGNFVVEPEAKSLLINVTDNSFYDVVFNSSVGKAVYELPSSESMFSTVFLEGDNRVVVNQSTSTITQLYESEGTESPEITLSYRPLASSTEIESNDEKPLNNLRIYILNLNSSQSLTFQGSFYLRINCVNVTSTLRSYNFSYPITSLTVKATLDGVDGEVSLPISSSAEGSLVNLEIVTCEVQLQKTEV
jgi:hypothetical protein